MKFEDSTLPDMADIRLAFEAAHRAINIDDPAVGVITDINSMLAVGRVLTRYLDPVPSTLICAVLLATAEANLAPGDRAQAAALRNAQSALGPDVARTTSELCDIFRSAQTQRQPDFRRASPEVQTILLAYAACWAGDALDFDTGKQSLGAGRDQDLVYAVNILAMSRTILNVCRGTAPALWRDTDQLQQTADAALAMNLAPQPPRLH